MTAAEYLEYAAFEDTGLLLKLLFAFATDNIELDVDIVQNKE